MEEVEVEIEVEAEAECENMNRRELCIAGWARAYVSDGWIAMVHGARSARKLARFVSMPTREPGDHGALTERCDEFLRRVGTMAIGYMARPAEF